MKESYVKHKANDEKVARVNAFMDGFWILIQGLGGAFGASIHKEALNQSIMKANDNYPNLHA